MKKKTKMSKKARSEGNKVAMNIKANKTEYYISDVNLEDNENDVVAAAVSVRKTLGKMKSGFMLISAGVEKLIVVIDVPDSPKLSASEWLSHSLNNFTFTTLNNNTNIYAKAVLELETPFKNKDIVRSSAFTFLRQKGLLEEEESDEFEYEFE